MSQVTYKIGAFDAAARKVPVTFTRGDITHNRDVNAALDEDGNYDEAATEARVQDVALGVAHKIDVGAIGAPVLEVLPEIAGG